MIFDRFFIFLALVAVVMYDMLTEKYERHDDTTINSGQKPMGIKSGSNLVAEYEYFPIEFIEADSQHSSFWDFEDVEATTPHAPAGILDNELKTNSWEDFEVTTNTLEHFEETTNSLEDFEVTTNSLEDFQKTANSLEDFEVTANSSKDFEVTANSSEDFEVTTDHKEYEDDPEDDSSCLSSECELPQNDDILLSNAICFFSLKDLNMAQIQIGKEPTSKEELESILSAADSNPNWVHLIQNYLLTSDSINLFFIIFSILYTLAEYFE